MVKFFGSFCLVSALIVGSVAAAGGTPHPVGKWCAADQASLCPGLEWNAGLGKCLRKNAASVSATCKQHHPKMFGKNPPPANSTGE